MHAVWREAEYVERDDGDDDDDHDGAALKGRRRSRLPFHRPPFTRCSSAV